MKKITIIDKQPSRIPYEKHLPNTLKDAELKIYHMTNNRVSRLTRKDITIYEEYKEELQTRINNSDMVILVGAEALKEFSDKTGARDFTGRPVELKNKFIEISAPATALINPAAAAFNPSIVPVIKQGDEDIARLLDIGNVLDEGVYVVKEDDSESLEVYLQSILDNKPKVVALDTETDGFNSYRGGLLGVSISHEEKQGVYYGVTSWSDEAIKLLQKIINTIPVVLHNAKFDQHWLARQLGISWRNAYELNDTMILHYVLDERPGHGLKKLALRYTTMGDYDSALDDFKKAYCKSHKIKAADFNYGLIPFSTLAAYAAKDTDATIRLFNLFRPLVAKNRNLNRLYKFLMRSAMNIFEIEYNGLPVSLERLHRALAVVDEKLEDARTKLFAIPQVAKFGEDQGAPYNPGSVVQTRKVLYDYLGLPVVRKYTEGGALSVSADVLNELKGTHEAVELLLTIAKYNKIRNTYLTKIIANIDPDGRLRISLNLTTTTSGRLSSSGNINIQTLPRDDGLVKGCVVARPGYKIVAWDMQTAEVFVAAVLSGDKKLQKIFTDGGDFHGAMAKQVFKLPCSVNEVKNLYPDLRQAAKAVTFGILYGSGPATVAEQVNKYGEEGSYFSPKEAAQAIKDYFAAFPTLAKWIKETHALIKERGYVYLPYGRKRRLREHKSKDKSVVAGELRSGLNAIVQGTSSDILLEAVCKLQERVTDKNMDCKILMMVHDSIVAEVKEESVEEYNRMLVEAIEESEITIPGRPMGMDMDGCGEDYSFGKIEKQYPEVVTESSNVT